MRNLNLDPLINQQADPLFQSANEEFKRGILIKWAVNF
jgi:hypothetical protein